MQEVGPAFSLFHYESQLSKVYHMDRRDSSGGGVIHYRVRRGCASVLGSFWPENSGIGIYFTGKFFDWGILALEFSPIGVYCYTQNSGYGC